ncbi:hypothetical protein ACGF5M_04050 [Gemmatimonadota bacterium]
MAYAPEDMSRTSLIHSALKGATVRDSSLQGEGVTAINQRLDRFEISVNARFDALEATLHRLHMDHELRMTALEARCSDA